MKPPSTNLFQNWHQFNFYFYHFYLAKSEFPGDWLILTYQPLYGGNIPSWKPSKLRSHRNHQDALQNASSPFLGQYDQRLSKVTVTSWTQNKEPDIESPRDQVTRSRTHIEWPWCLELKMSKESSEPGQTSPVQHLHLAGCTAVATKGRTEDLAPRTNWKASAARSTSLALSENEHLINWLHCLRISYLWTLIISGHVFLFLCFSLIGPCWKRASP